jgi:hypothetical protein
MILLYSFVSLLLGFARFLISRRVAALERKYARAAHDAQRFLRGPTRLEGNSNRPDPCEAARRQYALGRLVEKRDRLEAKHEVWLNRYGRFDRLVNGIRDWKGKKLPYTFGVLDVSFVLALIDYLGAGEYVSARRLVEVVSMLLNR